MMYKVFLFWKLQSVIFQNIVFSDDKPILILCLNSRPQSSFLITNTF